ncbi:MAG: SDR family NAD(P)-dependent oxidoreductase [Nostoc sp.]|uniref:SDR family NAD(P)-dependent oxidoreductase n=1 Tax=Nostoc sp. TaxID=1180 RepID=UPI002FF95214
MITGGDSGIGRAVAIAFAREGADVAISYLESEEADAKEVIELIQQAGRKAVALGGDITDENFCRKLVADAVESLGGLDILVNNAGAQQTQPGLEDISSEQFDKVLMSAVLEMLERISHKKAENLRNHCQDEASAKLWDKAARQIEQINIDI